MLSAKTADAPNMVARPVLVKPAGREPKPLGGLLVNGLVTITPELARRIILECGYERQRPVRPLHAAALAMQMRRKEWTAGTQIHFARMAADGWLRLLDGQHRLHAVVEANTAVEFQVLVTDCKTESDVVRLYRRHDRLAVNRSVVDVLRAEGIPERLALSHAVSRGVFNAALVIANAFNFGGRYIKSDPYLYRSDEARLRLCEPWWSAAQQFSDAISRAEGPVKSAICASGPLAVALVTLRNQEAKADAFWRGFANNDGLKRDDPRAAYRRFLGVGKGGRQNQFEATKATSIAWNAFYEDRTLDYLRVTNAPIRIVGCNIEG